MSPKRRSFLVTASIAAGAAIMTLLPGQAQAYYARFGFPGVVVAPPPYVYAPPPGYYYRPPVAYAPPHRFWIPGHYRGPYWVPGHWAWR